MIFQVYLPASGTFSFGVQKREGRALVSVQAKSSWGGCSFLDILWGDTEFTSCYQAALLLSLLWMPALLPLASRLQLLPRALLSMASGSPPFRPSPASGSDYVPGSVSAAFVTCPNEKVAKEIARWGPQCGEGDQEGSWGWGRRVPSRCFLPAPAWKPASGLAVQKSGSWGALSGVISSPSGLWWRSAWQPVSTSSLRLHPCES